MGEIVPHHELNTYRKGGEVMKKLALGLCLLFLLCIPSGCSALNWHQLPATAAWTDSDQNPAGFTDFFKIYVSTDGLTGDVLAQVPAATTTYYLDESLGNGFWIIGVQAIAIETPPGGDPAVEVVSSITWSNNITDPVLVPAPFGVYTFTIKQPEDLIKQ
jgi:hypothetical protein